MKPKVLFLCTGNSCRSQMAEGWARTLIANECDSYSAGTQPHELNQMAVRVMKECAVDISAHQSKSLDSLQSVQFDLIVTVCDSAAASCPTPPSVTRTIHAPFDDPPKLAESSLSDEETMKHYRRVRDEIKSFVLTIPTMLR